MRQAVFIRCGQKLGVARPLPGLGSADVVSDSRTAGILPGEQARSCGRADGTRSVRSRELRSFLRQPVEVRRLIERAAVASEVPLAEIVGQEENNVRP